MRSICSNCGQFFETSDPNNEFCSDGCEKQYIKQITSTRFTNITITLNLRNELIELQTQIEKKTNKRYAYWRIINACMKHIASQGDIVEVLKKWL